MTRWIELRGVHIDADAVVAVERAEVGAAALLTLASGSGVRVGLNPLPGERFDAEMEYPVYPQIKPRFGRRWFRRVDLPMTADERRQMRVYEQARSRFDFEYAQARQAFTSERFAELVAAITGAAGVSRPNRPGVHESEQTS